MIVIIEKRPPMWKDFKNCLKYKCKKMNIEKFIVQLRIEKDNRKSDKRIGCQILEPKVNMVKNWQRTKRGSIPSNTSSKKNNKNAKNFNGNCYNCGKADIG